MMPSSRLKSSLSLRWARLGDCDEHGLQTSCQLQSRVNNMSRVRSSPHVRRGWWSAKAFPHAANLLASLPSSWAYGATVARLTPDQEVGRSNRSGLKHTTSQADSHGTLTSM